MLLWQGNSIYDTEADKRRLRNIRHDNKQDIDFLKKIEANSLSIGQVRDVISGQLVLGEQKEIRNRNQCSMRNSVRSIRQTGGKTSSMRNSMWSI
jgi:hypothetical protein